MSDISSVLALFAAFALVIIICGIISYVISSIVFMIVLKKSGSTSPWIAWIPPIRLFALDSVATSKVTRAVINLIFAVMYSIATAANTLDKNNDLISLVVLILFIAYAIERYIVCTYIQYKICRRVYNFDGWIAVVNIFFRGVMWIVLAFCEPKIQEIEKDKDKNKEIAL